MNPEIEELEDALDFLLNALKEALQSGENIPEEIQLQASQEIEYLTGELDKLYSMENNEPPSIQAIEEEEAVAVNQIAPSAPSVPPTAPPPGNIPELEAAPHESSNINAFRYDPETEQLYVKFQGDYPQQNGPTYQYEGIPKYIYNIFAQGSVAPKTSGRNAWHTWKRGVTPSHGAAMNALIKAGQFPYQRLS